MKIDRISAERRVIHTAEYAVEGVEPIKKTYGKHLLQPDRVTITIEDGKLRHCHVSGPRILKAGLSESSTLAVDYFTHNLDRAPEWVRSTVRAALLDAAN